MERNKSICVASWFICKATKGKIPRSSRGRYIQAYKQESCMVDRQRKIGVVPSGVKLWLIAQ